MKFIMNFLRSPFQFRSTEQSSNKSESASPVVENMFIDPTTGIPTDPKWRATSPGVGASISGSPRLQHRVPGFENNGNHPADVITESSMPPSSNEGNEKSQRVHVVPIKIENVDDSSSPRKRPGAFHSSSGTIPRSSQFGPLHPNFEEFNSRKRHSSGPAAHKKSETTESKPKVCNIPIFVEGRDTPVVPKTQQSSHNVPVHATTPSTQTTAAKQNGGNLGKCSTKTKPQQDAKQNSHDASLNQISKVLSEFQALKTSVDEFRGIPQDKQYRYLDEMLTRCMLKLDNVETYGDDEVRASRKAAIKAVEKCVNDLESHAQANAKLDQPSVAAESAEEKPSSSELADTKKEEMNVSEEQTVSVSEDIQKANGETSISNEQSAAEESNVPSDKPLCPGGTDTKPELTETPPVLAGSSDHMDVDDTELKTQVQNNQSAGSGYDSKTPNVVVGANSEPMEAAVVTDLGSQSVDLPKQTEPMDSDKVSEDKLKLDSEMEVKHEIADSEIVGKPVAAENETSLISAEISN